MASPNVTTGSRPLSSSTPGSAWVGRINRSGMNKRQLPPRSDDELADSLLRNAELPCAYLVGNDAVANFTALNVNSGKELTTGRRADAKHVFHDEHRRLVVGNVAQERLVEVASQVIHQAFAVVGAIDLSCFREALAGRPADDDVYAPLVRQHLVQVFGSELGKVCDNRLRIRPVVCPKCLDCRLIVGPQRRGNAGPPSQVQVTNLHSRRRGL